MGEVTAARIAFADNAITMGRQSFVANVDWVEAADRTGVHIAQNPP